MDFSFICRIKNYALIFQLNCKTKYPTVMKNPIKPLQTEFQNPTEIKVTKAIQRIQNWVEEKYPSLAAVSKSKLIVECLIELAEERKILYA